MHSLLFTPEQYRDQLHSSQKQREIAYLKYETKNKSIVENVQQQLNELAQKSLSLLDPAFVEHWGSSIAEINVQQRQIAEEMCTTLTNIDNSENQVIEDAIQEFMPKMENLELYTSETLEDIMRNEANKLCQVDERPIVENVLLTLNYEAKKQFECLLIVGIYIQQLIIKRSNYNVSSFYLLRFSTKHELLISKLLTE